jgi:hypothetical protein
MSHPSRGPCVAVHPGARIILRTGRKAVTWSPGPASVARCRAASRCRRTADPWVRWRSGEPLRPISPRWWRSSGSGISSPTDWPGSRTDAGCCWSPGSTAGRSATCSWTAGRPTRPRSAATSRTCPARPSRGPRATPAARHRHRPGPGGGEHRPPARPWAPCPGCGRGQPRGPAAVRTPRLCRWGHGTIVGTWVERDRDGPPVTVSERLHLLVKPLPGHGPGRYR